MFVWRFSFIIFYFLFENIVYLYVWLIVLKLFFEFMCVWFFCCLNVRCLIMFWICVENYLLKKMHCIFKIFMFFMLCWNVFWFFRACMCVCCFVFDAFVNHVYCCCGGYVLCCFSIYFLNWFDKNKLVSCWCVVGLFNLFFWLFVELVVIFVLFCFGFDLLFYARSKYKNNM